MNGAGDHDGSGNGGSGRANGDQDSSGNGSAGKATSATMSVADHDMGDHKSRNGG